MIYLSYVFNSKENKSGSQQLSWNEKISGGFEPKDPGIQFIAEFASKTAQMNREMFYFLHSFKLIS